MGRLLRKLSLVQDLSLSFRHLIHSLVNVKRREGTQNNVIYFVKLPSFRTSAWAVPLGDRKEQTPRQQAQGRLLYCLAFTGHVGPSDSPHVYTQPLAPSAASPGFLCSDTGTFLEPRVSADLGHTFSLHRDGATPRLGRSCDFPQFKLLWMRKALNWRKSLQWSLVSSVVRSCSSLYLLHSYSTKGSLTFRDQKVS